MKLRLQDNEKVGCFYCSVAATQTSRIAWQAIPELKCILYQWVFIKLLGLPQSHNDGALTSMKLLQSSATKIPENLAVLPSNSVGKYMFTAQINKTQWLQSHMRVTD